MVDIVTTSQVYKLRAGYPMPIGNGTFIMHTFMAEMSDVYNYLYTNTLPDSTEFRGQGGNYISANFTKLLDKNDESFQGRITNNPEFIDEDYIS